MITIFNEECTKSYLLVLSRLRSERVSPVVLHIHVPVSLRIPVSLCILPALFYKLTVKDLVFL